MPALLDRLRSALAHAYVVERELATGGMGAIFIAHDAALDRRVAVKILRPELATALAVDRFLREGRTLASLRHPNIVPVHAAGEADGLFYYVMDLLEGETLEQRLTRGALPLPQVQRLADDLLAGLSYAHANGVVHRDVKPANIFFHDGRAVLADFGIAISERPAETRTRTGASPGSPAYMAPEQLRGEATERSDIYAAAMVLFEALTGRRWADVDPSDASRWRGIPRDLALVVRRALEWAPERRWATAAAFREQLRRAPRLRRRRRALLAGAFAVAALAGGALWSSRSETSPVAAPLGAPGDLALLPLQTIGGLDPMVGRDVAMLASLTLDGLPGFTVVSPRLTFLTAEQASTGSDAEVAQRLHTRYIARGSVARVNGGFEARVLVVEPATGDVRPLIAVRSSGDDHALLADAVARELIRSIHPQLASSYRANSTLSSDVRALREFLAGEYAAQRNAWHSAERHYVAAVALDSDFALAQWRLANARRWLPRWEHGTAVDLSLVYAKHRDQFSERDRMLLEAELAPFGQVRIARYEQAARRFPRDPYTLLLYGDEIFHRGPLFGSPLERAVGVLAEAAALDSALALVHEHLAWAYLLLGDRERARHAVDALARTAAPPERGAVYAPAVIEYAFTARFDPEQSARSVGQLSLGNPAASAAWMSHAVRYGLAFGIPEAQLALARMLASTPGAGPVTRAIALEAQAHALLALGRAAEAFAKADSVAALRGTAEARAEAASWRVLPAALGWSITSPEEVQRGREMLERIAGEGDAPAAVAWALAIDALRAGDRARIARWLPQANNNAPDLSAEVFHATLRGTSAARDGDLRRALAITAPVPAFVPQNAPGSVVRAVRYVSRADWFEQLGDLDAADREWLWSDNTDQIALAREGAAAGEVDRIVGSYANYRRGMLALRRGDTQLACRLLGNVVRYWSEADPPLQPLVQDARTHVEGRCR